MRGTLKKILILGGTREAADCAKLLVAQGHDVTTSLAGRTREPHPVSGNIRTGGFGGAEGLAAYLLENHIDQLIDMGDFVGGLLKYVRAHPVPNITIAGGFAKLTKLAQGAMDLHSSRSQIDFEFLANIARDNHLNQTLIAQIQNANTAQEALELSQQSGFNLAIPIAKLAHTQAIEILRGAPVNVEILVTDRKGEIIARHG